MATITNAMQVIIIFTLCQPYNKDIFQLNCFDFVQTALSSAEAENTLKYLKDVLFDMKSQHHDFSIAQYMSSAKNDRALRVKAYKNGNGFRNGSFLIAGTFLEASTTLGSL